VSREMRVTVQDGSVIDEARKLLCWAGDAGPVKSTVNEVYELGQAPRGSVRLRNAPPHGTPIPCALPVFPRRRSARSLGPRS